jgi:signal transduction histidine kinase
MTDHSSDHALRELQATIRQLNSYPLPKETRASIHKASKWLSLLSSDLDKKAEAQRLAALYRVSHFLGTSLDLDDVLTQVMDAVIELTGAERGFLMLIDPDTNNLDLRAARNIERETLKRKDMEISRTVIKSVVESGEGVVTTDAQSDPRFAGHESVIFFSLKSLLCAPLMARGRATGVIYVDNRAQEGLFSTDDLALLDAFATTAAITIENARLYTQTDQALSERIGELETLSQIDHELNQSLDYESVLDITLKWAVKGTEAENGWIALIDQDSQVLQSVSGPPDAPLDHPRIPTAIEEFLPFVAQPNDDNLALIVAPFRHGRSNLGVIIVSRLEPFSNSALQFLSRLAARAVIAIENAQLYSAVQIANDTKSRFISLVAHELRTPMTSIKGYTDLLLKESAGPVTEGQENFLKVIKSNVDRMDALVADLADISRIETGNLKLDIVPLKLQDTFREALGSLDPKFESKNQTLIIQIPDDLPPVKADSNRLIQVLTNLLTNAWKYTPADGKVTVSAHQNNDRIHLDITDTGIGITTEDQKSLFTQFFRSEDEVVRDESGWGLGLHVSKRLIEMMDGEIGVTSHPGKGSTFWITIPISNVQPSTTI